MVTWLCELYGLDKLEAYQLLSQISEAPLANVVDANYSAVTKVAKALLPQTNAYRGMHRHLREVAATAGRQRAAGGRECWQLRRAARCGRAMFRNNRGGKGGP